MSLRVDQLKKVTFPLGSINYNKLFGTCGVAAVTAIDVISSYLAIYGTSFTTDSTLEGLGTTASPLKIAQQSATTGQVLTWNGTTWAPAAGGSQSLSYSAPNILLSGGSSVSILSFISSDSPNMIEAGTDSNLKVAIYRSSELEGSGTSGDPLGIAQQSATAGQALTWNGTAWAPSTITGTLPSGATGQLLRWDGAAWAAVTERTDVQTGLTGTTTILPEIPLSAPVPKIFLNGQLKTSGLDYTISTNTITWITFILETSDVITSIYFK
jgi:hypothetical protein